MKHGEKRENNVSFINGALSLILLSVFNTENKKKKIKKKILVVYPFDYPFFSSLRDRILISVLL